MKKKIIPFIIGALMLTGCDDLFSPAIATFQGVENMYNDAEYARGILHNVYTESNFGYENAFGKAAGKQGVRGTPQHPAVCS